MSGEVAAARIDILSTSSLSFNPRVAKEAALLATAGYEVTVLGSWVDEPSRERDQRLASPSFKFIPVVDCAARGRLWWQRGVRKAGHLAWRYGSIENPWQLGYGYLAFRRVAAVRRADLYIAHSELGTAVAASLHRAGCRVAIDLEDWYSEDLLPEARRNRPIPLLRALERELLSRAVYASCTSRVMSTAIAAAYGCPSPAVVYNAFPWVERTSLDGRAEDRTDRRNPSIHWFSQTVGPGRGLEDLLAALPYLKHPAEIHLRGKRVAGFDRWLIERTPEAWRGRVILHDLVTNNQLLSRIAEHDIGFAGEMKYCRNRELTVTNKILQYLLAGLAVVASDTAGQREVAEQAGEAVLLYPCGEPKALGARLNVLLGSPERLSLAKAAALRAAEETFCWERQEHVLLEGVSRALGGLGS